MPSAATTSRQENPWHRLVRCLVLLLVARLDRKIARMLAELDTLEYLSPAYMALNERCYWFEDLRDAYLAWLKDPANPMPRQYDPNVRWRLRFRSPRPRHAGMRPHAPASHVAIQAHARCTTPRAAPPGAPSPLR